MQRTSYVFESESEARKFLDLLSLHDGNLRGTLQTMSAQRRKSLLVRDVVLEHISLLTNVGPDTVVKYGTRPGITCRGSWACGPSMSSKSRTSIWVQDLGAKGLSPKTIHNLHGLLSAAMKTAIQLGYRQDSPCEGVALPKSTATDDTMMFLSEDEFALLETNMTPSYQLFTRFLVMTGLRWGEATALLVSDLNLKGKPPSVRVTKAWKHDGDSTITSALRRRPGRGARSPCRGRWPWTSPTTLPASPPTIWYSATVGDSGVTHGNFHKKHWTNAINAAFGRVDKDGKFVVTRRPRIHDLRHTHAS